MDSKYIITYSHEGIERLDKIVVIKNGKPTITLHSVVELSDPAVLADALRKMAESIEKNPGGVTA